MYRWHSTNRTRWTHAASHHTGHGPAADAPLLPTLDPALAARVDRLLSGEHVLWLATVRDDGGPHLIPIWFVWNGREIVIYSKPDAQKVRNLRERPTVMIAVGDPDRDFDVQLIEAIAHPLTQRTAEVIGPEHGEKYGELMATLGITPEEYNETYSQPIVMTPTRFLAWGGRGAAERGYAAPVGAISTRTPRVAAARPA
jgi:PPOX class probable F420-dependent enzyme